MDTVVYIDGNNFYFGCLRQSPHKWLDIHRLFSAFVLRNLPFQANLLKVKYFTADIKVNAASREGASQLAQDSYNDALKALYPDQVEIIKGYHSLGKSWMPRYQKPIDMQDRVSVWRVEEKQTDVNVALHMYRDTMRNACAQLVLVSNDTDLAPALEMIRQDRGKGIRIGLVVPTRERVHVGDGFRSPSPQLRQHADWIRRYLREEELAGSQLPPVIHVRQKSIAKPDWW